MSAEEARTAFQGCKDAQPYTRVDELSTRELSLETENQICQHLSHRLPYKQNILALYSGQQDKLNEDLVVKMRGQELRGRKDGGKD